MASYRELRAMARMKQCTQCKALIPEWRRADAKFCSSACRAKYHMPAPKTGTHHVQINEGAMLDRLRYHPIKQRSGGLGT